jgi:hypothetical protein
MRKRLGAVQSAAVLVVVFLAVAVARSSGQTLCSTGVCVTTWQNDTYRTGDNLNEGTLTYNTITKNTFGQLCAANNLDGQVYAQPLVVTNVTKGPLRLSFTW